VLMFPLRYPVTPFSEQIECIGDRLGETVSCDDISHFRVFVIKITAAV